MFMQYMCKKILRGIQLSMPIIAVKAATLKVVLLVVPSMLPIWSFMQTMVIQARPMSNMSMVLWYNKEKRPRRSRPLPILVVFLARIDLPCVH